MGKVALGEIFGYMLRGNDGARGYIQAVWEIGGMKIAELLTYAREQKAADIHICAGAPIFLRIGRDLTPVTKEQLTAQQSRELSLQLLNEEQKALFEEKNDFDSMVADENGRYRVNIGSFDGKVGSVIRILPDRPRTITELKLPPVIIQCANYEKGMVLITGSTSQGKTTTMASMIHHVNENYRRHVVTIEDPIEYVHTNIKSVVRQREIGKDTADFNTGLRAALRQDPDVIAIGEMRDYETIKIALTAAETGVFVLSTLHIISIDKIIERLLSYAPAEEEMHVRYLLADCLRAVIHQELLPTSDGNKRVACEVLVVTDAAKNILRRRGSFMLRNLITSGKRFNMVTMTDSLGALLDEGIITEDVANGVMANYST